MRARYTASTTTRKSLSVALVLWCQVEQQCRDSQSAGICQPQSTCAKEISHHSRVRDMDMNGYGVYDRCIATLDGQGNGEH